MPDPRVALTWEGPVALITIDRPERRNAVDGRGEALSERIEGALGRRSVERHSHAHVRGVNVPQDDMGISHRCEDPPWFRCRTPPCESSRDGARARCRPAGI